MWGASACTPYHELVSMELQKKIVDLVTVFRMDDPAKEGHILQSALETIEWRIVLYHLLRIRQEEKCLETSVQILHPNDHDQNNTSVMVRHTFSYSQSFSLHLGKAVTKICVALINLQTRRLHTLKTMKDTTLSVKNKDNTILVELYLPCPPQDNVEQLQERFNREVNHLICWKTRTTRDE